MGGKMNMNNKILYGLIMVVVVVLSWSITTSINASANPAKYQYYQNLQQQSETGCGDLNDNGNVQHLSHHPNQYTECIKQVDRQKFKEAVGTDKDVFMKNNNIL